MSLRIYNNPYSDASYVANNFKQHESDTTYLWPFFLFGCVAKRDRPIFFGHYQGDTIGGFAAGTYYTGNLLHRNIDPLYVHNAPELPNYIWEGGPGEVDYNLGEEVLNIYQYQGYKTAFTFTHPSGFIYNTGTQAWEAGGTMTDGFWNHELAPGIVRENLGYTSFKCENCLFESPYNYFSVPTPRQIWVRDKNTYRTLGLDPVPGSPCIQGNQYLNGDCFLNSGERVDGVNWIDLTDENNKYDEYGKPLAFRWADTFYMMSGNQQFMLNRTYDESALCQAGVSGHIYLSLSAYLRLNATDDYLKQDAFWQPTEVGYYLAFCSGEEENFDTTNCFLAPSSFNSIDDIKPYPLFACTFEGLEGTVVDIASDKYYWHFPFYLNFPYYDVDTTGGVVNHVIGKAYPYLTHNAPDSQAFYSHQLNADLLQQRERASFFVALGPSGQQDKWIYATLDGDVSIEDYEEDSVATNRYFISIKDNNHNVLGRAPIFSNGGNIDICYAYNIFSISCGGAKTAVEHHFIDTSGDIRVMIGANNFLEPSNSFIEVDCVYFKHPSAQLNTWNVYDDYCLCETVGNVGNTIYTCIPYPTTRNVFTWQYKPGTYTVETWGVKCTDCGGSCLAFQYGGAPEAIGITIDNIANSNMFCGDRTLYGVASFANSMPFAGHPPGGSVQVYAHKRCDAIHAYDCVVCASIVGTTDIDSELDGCDVELIRTPYYEETEYQPVELYISQTNQFQGFRLCGNVVIWFGGIPYNPAANGEHSVISPPLVPTNWGGESSISNSNNTASLVIIKNGDHLELKSNFRCTDGATCQMDCTNTNVMWSLWDLSKECGTDICSFGDVTHPCDIDGSINYIHIGDIGLFRSKHPCNGLPVNEPDEVTIGINSDLELYDTYFNYSSIEVTTRTIPFGIYEIYGYRITMYGVTLTLPGTCGTITEPSLTLDLPTIVDSVRNDVITCNAPNDVPCNNDYMVIPQTPQCNVDDIYPPRLQGCISYNTYSLGPLGFKLSSFFNPPHNFLFNDASHQSVINFNPIQGCPSTHSDAYIVTDAGTDGNIIPEMKPTIESPVNCRKFNETYQLTNSASFERKSYVLAGRCLDGTNSCINFNDESVLCKNTDGDISIHSVYTRLVGLTHSWFEGHNNNTLMIARGTDEEPVPYIQQCDYNKYVSSTIGLTSYQALNPPGDSCNDAYLNCCEPDMTFENVSGNLALHTSITNYKNTGPSNCRLAHDYYLNYSYAYEFFDGEEWQRHEGVLNTLETTTCTHRSMYLTYDLRDDGWNYPIREAYELLHGPRNGCSYLDLSLVQPYAVDSHTLGFRRIDALEDVDGIGKTAFDVYVAGYRYTFSLDTEIEIGAELPGTRKTVWLDVNGEFQVVNKTVQEAYDEYVASNAMVILVPIAEIIYGTSEYEYFDAPNEYLYKSSETIVVDLRPLNTNPLKAELVQENYIDYVSGDTRYRLTNWYEDFSGFEDVAKTTLFVGGGGQIINNDYACCSDSLPEGETLSEYCGIPFYELDFSITPRVELGVYNGGIIFRDTDNPPSQDLGWLHTEYCQYDNYIVYFSGNPIKVSNEENKRIELPDTHSIFSVYLKRDGTDLELQYVSGTDIDGTRGWDWLPICKIDQEHLSTNEIDYRYNAVSGGFFSSGDSIVNWDNAANVSIEPTGIEDECWHYSLYNEGGSAYVDGQYQNINTYVLRQGIKQELTFTIEDSSMEVQVYLDEDGVLQYCLGSYYQGFANWCLLQDIPWLVATGTFEADPGLTDIRNGGETNYAEDIGTIQPYYTAFEAEQPTTLKIKIPSCNVHYGDNIANIGGTLSWYMSTPLLTTYYLYAKTLNNGISYSPYVSTIPQNDNTQYIPLAIINHTGLADLYDARQYVSVVNSGVGGFLDKGNMEMKVDLFGACVIGETIEGPAFIINLPCDDEYTTDCYNTGGTSGIARGFTFVTPTGGIYTKLNQEYIPLESGFGRYYTWYTSSGTLDSHFEKIYKIFPAHDNYYIDDNGNDYAVSVLPCEEGENPPNTIAGPTPFSFPEDSLPLMSFEYIRTLTVTDQRTQPDYKELDGYFSSLQLHHITQNEDTCLGCGQAAPSDRYGSIGNTYQKCGTAMSIVGVDALMGDELEWQSGQMLCSVACELYSGVTI